MKNILLVLILCLCFSSLINAQTTTFKFNSAQLKNLNIGDDVWKEAEIKQITTDTVYISFTISANCVFENFKISHSGKLKSFTEVVEKQSKEILIQFQKQFDCKEKKETNYNVPIIIHF
jgi:hypothetical protein